MLMMMLCNDAFENEDVAKKASECKARCCLPVKEKEQNDRVECKRKGSERRIRSKVICTKSNKSSQDKERQKDVWVSTRGKKTNSRTQHRRLFASCERHRTCTRFTFAQSPSAGMKQFIFQYSRLFSKL